MITVCPLSAVPDNLRRLAPTHLISLLDPVEMIATPPGFEGGRHLKVGINDIVQAQIGAILPQEAHVAKMIEFLQDWQASGPLLIHCWAGISRSTATAFMALCILNEGREHAAAQALRLEAPHAQPNRRIVQLADRLLKRDGRMVDAVAGMGPASMVPEGVSFTVHHRLEIPTS